MRKINKTSGICETLINFVKILSAIEKMCKKYCEKCLKTMPFALKT